MASPRMTDPRVAELAAALRTIAPADEAEAAHLARILELLDSTAAPFSADQYLPGHVTGSAMIVSPGAAVLLIRHPTLGRWLQPGGHVDPEDASVGAAAAREALEETGLAVDIAAEVFDVDVHPIPARGHRSAHLHFDVRFLARVAGLPAPESREGIVTRWCDWPEAVALADDPGLRRMLIKLRARGLLPSP